MLGDINSFRATKKSEGKQSIHSFIHSYPAVCVFSVDWLVSYALCDWTILAKVLTRLSGNAKNTFLQVFPSIEHVYIIKRQILWRSVLVKIKQEFQSAY